MNNISLLGHTSLGALGDSYYEYLLKSWLVTSKRDVQAKRMYDEAMDVSDPTIRLWLAFYRFSCFRLSSNSLYGGRKTASHTLPNTVVIVWTRRWIIWPALLVRDQLLLAGHWRLYAMVLIRYRWNVRIAFGP